MSPDADRNHFVEFALELKQLIDVAITKLTQLESHAPAASVRMQIRVHRTELQVSQLAVMSAVDEMVTRRHDITVDREGFGVVRARLHDLSRRFETLHAFAEPSVAFDLKRELVELQRHTMSRRFAEGGGARPWP